MKVTLTFDLPEEGDALYTAQRGQDYLFVLQDMDRYLRNRLKYGDLSEEQAACLDAARHQLHVYLEDRGIDLHCNPPADPPTTSVVSPVRVTPEDSSNLEDVLLRAHALGVVFVEDAAGRMFGVCGRIGPENLVTDLSGLNDPLPPEVSDMFLYPKVVQCSEGPRFLWSLSFKVDNLTVSDFGLCIKAGATARLPWEFGK